MEAGERNPVALVTGGAVRVGKAVCSRLASIGYDVAVQYHRSIAEANQLASQFADSAVRIVLIQADLTHHTAARLVVEQAVGAFGRLDLLVNSAAILVPDSASITELARMKLLNVDAPRACIDAAAEPLKTSRGSIVNIADIAGLAPFSLHKAYSRTKAALIALTKKKAGEFAPCGVRVNAVCPGTVLPPTDYTPEQIWRLVDRIPMGRIGGAQDVAEAVCFFAGAHYVTGQILAVDGGCALSADQLKAR